MSPRIQIMEEKNSDIMDVQIMIRLQTEAEKLKALPEKTQREMCGRKALNSHHHPRRVLPSTVAWLSGTTEKETVDTVLIPSGYVPYSHYDKGVSADFNNERMRGVYPSQSPVYVRHVLKLIQFFHFHLNECYEHASLFIHTLEEITNWGSSIRRRG